MERQTELLQKLGKLAKLEVSETDEKLKEDFKKIVEYMDVIHEVDATGIQPLSYIQFEEGIQKEQMLAECMQFEERENTEYVFEKNLRFQKNIMEWNVFREDEPVLEDASFCRDELLKNAPKTEQGYLVVPKTVTE